MKTKKTDKKEKRIEFGVIELTGRQLLAEVGKEYTLSGLNLEKGKKFSIDKILLYVKGEDVRIGKPYLKDVAVNVEVVACKKSEKLSIFKYKSKARYRKKVGYREVVNRILIKKFVVK